MAALQQQMNTLPAHDLPARAAPRPALSGKAAPATTGEDGGETMTNADVLELRAAGLDDDNLIATIKSAKAAKFDLSPAGLRSLLQSKVSNRVIAAMRERK